jgi:hypothetical protein
MANCRSVSDRRLGLEDLGAVAGKLIIHFEGGLDLVHDRDLLGIDAAVAEDHVASSCKHTFIDIGGEALGAQADELVHALGVERAQALVDHLADVVGRCTFEDGGFFDGRVEIDDFLLAEVAVGGNDGQQHAAVTFLAVENVWSATAAQNAIHETHNSCLLGV